MSISLTKSETGAAMRAFAIAKRVLAVVIVAVCLWAIASALRGQSLSSIASALGAMPPAALFGAIVLVATNFIVMSGMEMLALRDAGVVLPFRRAAVSAFIGNALSVAAGLGPISGAGVRAGLFRQWGLPVQAAAATAVGTTLMSLSGGAILAATGLAIQPGVIATAFNAPAALVRGCGIAVLVAAACALIAIGRRRAVFSLLGASIRTPSGPGAVLRLGLGALDWVISANVLYVFLSFESRWAPLSFVAAFASAHFAGMAAGTPAGLGVFDALMLHIGAISASPAHVAAALLLYRLIAYATPALLALGPYIALSQVRTHEKP
jgi:phosphatidylglycerol lysyltransferase